MCRDPGSIGRIGQAARAGRMVDALAILCPSANEIMNEDGWSRACDRRC